MKPVKAPDQLTPLKDPISPNIGTGAGSQQSSTTITVGSSIDQSFLDRINELVQSATTFEVDSLILPIEINVFNDLPQGFDFTLTPEVDGKYGEIVFDAHNKQSVTVYANIPDVDGIINYEVRLIQND